MNRIMIILIAALLMVAVGLFLFSGEEQDAEVWGYGGVLYVARTMALIVMLANGSFYNTIFYKISKLAIAVLALGLTFKILHYPSSNELIVFGAVSASLLYAIYFFRKQSRPVLSYAKLALVLLTFLTIPLSLLHVFDYDTITVLILVREILTWVTFTTFVVTGLKDKSLLT